MIINYASSGVNKLKASLNDDARVVIYDRHMFIVQATGLVLEKSYLKMSRTCSTAEMATSTPKFLLLQRAIF